MFPGAEEVPDPSVKNPNGTETNCNSDAKSKKEEQSGYSNKWKIVVEKDYIMFTVISR